VSSIVTDQGIVHYEAYGRGQPVILLHGWLGSWGYWLKTMEILKRQYRCYALDFWGFGDSGKRRSSYHVSDFVDLVDQFMGRLGIEAAPIVGHSMGGTVAISLALTKPERVSRVIVVGSPIMGNSLNIFLRLAGKPLIAGVVWHLPVALKFGIKFFSPYIVKDWQKWYQMITRDLSSTTLEAFFSSINSLRQTDLRAELSTTATPIMGIYGVGDNVVSPNQASIIMKYASIPRVKMMDDCKHFPMLDAPQAFNDNLADFLAWEFVPPNSK
jgi:pimeloyl-ACP methyl ester carboxylesterase